MSASSCAPVVSLRESLPTPRGLSRRNSESRRLRILTFTTMYPNPAEPRHGLFVRARIRALARLADVQVMAPVPWCPPIAGLPERFYRCRDVARREERDALTVHHPRFAVIPGVLKSTDPVLLALSCLASIKALRHRFPFDLIDSHWACPDGAAGAILAAVTGVPFSMTLRGDDINIFAEDRSRRRVIQWALRRAARVIALSEELARKAIGLGAPKNRVAVIANGVDT
jgi:glycosyl transferase family 4